MLYRCRGCAHGEARGWLPAAANGPYLLALVGLSLGLLSAAAHGLRAWAGARPDPAEPPEVPWRVGVFGVAAALGLVAGAAAGLKAALEWAEYRAVARRPCPRCGGRRSHGFTRGFGV